MIDFVEIIEHAYHAGKSGEVEIFRMNHGNDVIQYAIAGSAGKFFPDCVIAKITGGKIRIKSIDLSMIGDNGESIALIRKVHPQVTVQTPFLLRVQDNRDIVPCDYVPKDIERRKIYAGSRSLFLKTVF